MRRAHNELSHIDIHYLPISSWFCVQHPYLQDVSKLRDEIVHFRNSGVKELN